MNIDKYDIYHPRWGAVIRMPNLSYEIINMYDESDTQHLNIAHHFASPWDCDKVLRFLSKWK